MFIFTEWTFLKIATFLLRYLKNKFKKKIWVFRNKLPSKMRRVDKMGHVFKKKETFKCTDWSNTILRTHPWNKILSHIIRDAWSLQMTAGWKLVVSEWMGKRERERDCSCVLSSQFSTSRSWCTAMKWQRVTAVGERDSSSQSCVRQLLNVALRIVSVYCCLAVKLPEVWWLGWLFQRIYISYPLTHSLTDRLTYFGLIRNSIV